jgi:ABC-type multidrug transport system fused ATPase/permease subunit
MPDKSEPQLPASMKPAAGGPAPGQASQGGAIAPGMKPVDGPIPPGAMPSGAPMPPGGVMPPPGAMPKGGAMPPPGEVPEGGGMMKAAPGSVMPPDGAMPQGGAVPEEMMKPKKKSARPYIGRSLKLLGEHKGAVIFTTVLTLIGALTPFLVSASFGPLVEILGNAARSTGMSNVWSATGSLYKAGPGTSGLQAWLATPLSFTTIFIIWAAATVGSAVLRFVQMWKTSNLEQRIVSQLQSRVYDHVQTLSLDFFTGGKTGALMQRVLNESPNVQKLITQVMLTPILDVIVLITALFYLFGMSWQMTLVAFALGPVAFVLFRFTMAQLNKSSESMMKTSRELNSELNESLTGMADIQIFNAQEKRSGRFALLANSTAGDTARLFMWMHLTNSNSLIYVALSTALVLLVGIQYGPRFGLGLGELIVFTGFIPAMFAPVQRIITSYSTYKTLEPGIVATYELLDTKPTVIEKPNARTLGDIHGDIKFDNVVFGYTPFKRILDGVSFDIKEGEIVAFVGAIGCGKSTIMNLLLRFLEQDGGTITIGGEDVTEVTLASLRDQVSKLSQFPFFLKDSIRENVRLGRANATDKEVEDACRRANIHNTIVNEIPGGYDCTVGDQVPSGGQKRLIAFARCLIRQPEVLLLDEPTENLNDTNRVEMAQFIRDYANESGNPRTAIIISHDMNFVHLVADRIIVIDKGKAVQTGTHEQLLAQEGIYKTLYELKNINPDLLRTREGGAGAADGEPDALPPGFVPA